MNQKCSAHQAHMFSKDLSLHQAFLENKTNQDLAKADEIPSCSCSHVMQTNVFLMIDKSTQQYKVM
jgi:hypothetical protein